MAKSGTSYSAKIRTVDTTTATKEILNLQQQLLHKLYTELDQEREASKSAVSEILSMIQRLQLEKASVELEAKHYKRMSEEKLFHANECLKIFADMIHQKELEISSMQCQIQAFKYKLLSLSFNHRNCGETERIEFEDVNMNFTLPVDCSNSITWSENKSLFNENLTIAVDQDLKDIGISYWQQIKKLDQMVKWILNGFNFVEKQSENLQKLQDIFEVPEVSQLRHINVVDERKLETEEDISGHDIKLPEPECATVVKKLIKKESESCSYSISENFFCNSNRRKILDHYNCDASSGISNAESRSGMKNLGKRIELIEDEANGLNSRQEMNVIGVQELTWMKETLNKIQTQLSKVQTDVESLKTSKSKKLDDLFLRILQEVMLETI